MDMEEGEKFFGSFAEHRTFMDVDQSVDQTMMSVKVDAD